MNATTDVILESIGMSQGWNDASKIILLCRFIDSLDAFDIGAQFKAYLQEQVDEENAAADIEVLEGGVS